MNRKSKIDYYFTPSKLKQSTLPKSIMVKEVNKTVKKRSLSLIKPATPSKSPKLYGDNTHNSSEIVDLCSDDEINPRETEAPSAETLSQIMNERTHGSGYAELSSPSRLTAPIMHLISPSSAPKHDSTGYRSDSSEATVIYSPPSTPQTPRRTPQTPASATKSPSSSKKYFSPIKKRAVLLKKPVRRNLDCNFAECSDKHDLFDEACLGMDDKTIFLLTAINKCICNPSLFRLLDEPAQCLLSKTMQVVKPGMRLVNRLYWHKEGWYRLDKISSLLHGKNEPKDDTVLHGSLNSLQEHGFITQGNTITFDEFTSILSAVELKQICKELKLKMNSKQDAISALKGFSRSKSINNFFSAKSSDNSARVIKIMSAKAGPCYKLSDLARKTIHDLNILMYLGMNYDVIREKKLELTLLFDKIKREPYAVEEDMLDDASVVFREKDEFESYLRAHTIHEEYIMEEDSVKKCDIVTKVFVDFKNISEKEMSWLKALPVWLRRFTPYHLYVRILEAGVQEIKKEKLYGLALEILDALITQELCRQHKKAEWYAEKALVLHKCSRIDEAANVLLEGFKSDLSEEEKDAMRNRATIFAKQKCLGLEEHVRAQLLEYATKDEILEKKLRGVHVYKQPMDRTNQRGKLKYETRTSDERIVQDVEEFCLSHYISTGQFTHGMNVEGRFVTTVFFLLFWDIIYWRPPDCVGVFLSRFQRYPLDLFCDSFYTNRRDSIEARLALIERCSIEEVLEIMHNRWHERPEGEISGLSITNIPWEQVREAARCAGAALPALCRRLAEHYRHAHTGFPDLTLWNTHTRQIRFVEVKSDTDRPSLKQIQWMHYLRRHGVDTEFCYVGVNTTRCKARSS